ncbi:hypothetical protein C2845_PM02G13000 [Panicum miliaceum]|uniref:Secreted protein n=1 Tax=Panicum miliaceum TaxID=4540 RepID=A0A3L6SDE4_PANMI|nr:hypothetical protein C2845_PM02G13000 [Panicum miliaceum]
MGCRVAGEAMNWSGGVLALLMRLWLISVEAINANTTLCNEKKNMICSFIGRPPVLQVQFLRCMGGNAVNK